MLYLFVCVRALTLLWWTVFLHVVGRHYVALVTPTDSVRNFVCVGWACSSSAYFSFFQFMKKIYARNTKRNLTMRIDWYRISILLRLVYLFENREKKILSRRLSFNSKYANTRDTLRSIYFCFLVPGKKIPSNTHSFERHIR